MKLFCTRNVNILEERQLMFGFKLPSVQLKKRKNKFVDKYDNTRPQHMNSGPGS